MYTHHNNLYALMCNYVLTTPYTILDESYRRSQQNFGLCSYKQRYYINHFTKYSHITLQSCL
jgi:hypothetical protein